MIASDSSLPEAVIVTRPYLPLATEYVDGDALKDVRDKTLVDMATECTRWSEDMDAFHASLITPAAIVLWRVLIAKERMLVANSLEHVLAEMGARKSDEGADTTPVPGENATHLDGSGTVASGDDHVSSE